MFRSALRPLQISCLCVGILVSASVARAGVITEDPAAPVPFPEDVIYVNPSSTGPDQPVGPFGSGTPNDPFNYIAPATDENTGEVSYDVGYVESQTIKLSDGSLVEMVQTYDSEGNPVGDPAVFITNTVVNENGNQILNENGEAIYQNDGISTPID